LKVEYDPKRDLMYIHFKSRIQKSATTETVIPGVMADFNKHGKLIGIEILDASEIIERKLEFEVKLLPVEVE
jgi:uncharacterized protein YuzE